MTLAATDAAFALQNAGSKTITGIPAGAECTTAETTTGSDFTTTIEDSDGTATDGVVGISADAVATVAFTNAYADVPQCVADEESISVVYSTQNNPDAPLDGSTVVYDRVHDGRDDMQLVYTIEKPCVTFPVPKIEYTGPWTLDGSDPDTYANYTVEFGAATPEIAAEYAAQIAAMNAMLATLPECENPSIDNFSACLGPVIDQWGDSIPVDITGTVKVSVGASTPGAGQLRFWLEQRDTGQRLSPVGLSPYVVTQPTLTLAVVGEVCSTTIETMNDGTYVIEPTHAQPTPISIAATPGDNGIMDDDATAIPVDTAGLSYTANGESFASQDAVADYLIGLPAGEYPVTANYTAPDGVAANQPTAQTVTVLGSDTAACVSKTLIPVKPTDPTTPTLSNTGGPALPGALLGGTIAIVLIGIALIVGTAVIKRRKVRNESTGD